MKEEKVYSVEEVIALAKDKRSVYIEGMNRIMPAAALQNWNAKLLYNAIQEGRIFRYIKGTKPYKKDDRKRHAWIPVDGKVECFNCGLVCDKSGYKTVYWLDGNKLNYMPECTK